MTTSLATRVSQALRPFSSRDPFDGFQKEMDDLVNRLKADFNGDLPLTALSPACDLSETDDALQIRMDVPGMKPSDINVETSGNTVRISGEHKEEKEEKGRTYHRVERRTGSFSRTVVLPTAVNEKQVAAECADGILTITLPKLEPAKTQKVPVVASK